MVPVELVAAEVEQHQNFWTPVGDQVRDNALIGLQHRDVRVGKLAECGGDAVVQVGAVGVGDQPVGISAQARPNGGGQQVRGGGLAVGARHTRHPAPLEQQLECV